MPVVRPKIAELAFQVYGRTLHPELYEVLQTRTIERNGFQAKIDITSAGHVVTWRYQGQVLTEVATAANQPLPEKTAFTVSSLDWSTIRFGAMPQWHALPC